MAPRSLLLAVALLLALVPVAAASDFLGARLSVGSVVTVESKATIDTTVSLTTTGPYTLAETAFPMRPGEVRAVSYQGTGPGTVTALMSPVNPTGDGTALSLTAAFVPAVPIAPVSRPIALFLLLGLLMVVSLPLIHRRKRNDRI